MALGVTISKAFSSGRNAAGSTAEINMTDIRELVRGITLGARDDREAEAAFLQRFGELVELPVEVSVAGVARMLTRLEQTPSHRRIRARVENDAGDNTWLVNFDAVRMAPGTEGAAVLAAYRCWLGYDLDEPVESESAGKVVSRQRVDKRLGELDEQIEQSLAALRRIDLDEVEPWLGDDDPWGHNKQYWPDSVERYLQEVASLSDVVDALEEVASAGFGASLRERAETILEGLAGVTFDYFCPDDVSSLAQAAIPLWISTVSSTVDNASEMAPLVEKFDRWVSAFELSYWLADLVESAGEPLRGALVRWLEEDITRTNGKHRREKFRVRALRTLYQQQGSIELLLERLPLGVLDSDDVVALMSAFEEQGDCQRALDVSEAWLAVDTENRYRSTGRVEPERRRLMRKLGRGDDAISEAWQAFEAQPSADGLDELREVVAEQERPQVEERATQMLGNDLYSLMSVVSKTAPSDALARCVAETDVDDLRKVSSWTLQDAAERLDPTWPEAAVKVYTALGWRHVDRGKSKYYDLGLDAFERAHELYVELGREDDWERLVEDVTDEHGRKRSFMPGFRKIANKS